MAPTQVVYSGPGFIRIFSIREAVLSAVETFLGASRIPAQISSWAQ